MKCNFFLCRLVSADDVAAGFTTVFVPAASGQPFAENAPRVFSTSDSAVVVLDARVAMMDLSVLAIPAEVHEPGEQPTVIVLICCSVLGTLSF